ncbi:hypothetical protein [Botrimarina mediterranea]|uniref:hypothetical protein n=1 Tax=Botrimarina mediterranea TaxID=2528022 RepID=UPI0011879886|nr:hypothetical protein K2D_46630 [Planctomycetes bacterium K2D]
MTENQLVFDYARDFPELAAECFREVLRDYIAREVASGRFDIEKLVSEAVLAEAKELTGQLFYNALSDEDEPLSKVIKREGTDRLLNLRRSVHSVMMGFEEDLERFRRDFENHLDQSRRDNRDRDDDGPDFDLTF